MNKNDDEDDEGPLTIEQLEQYRCMAQIEANFRIQDTTGFDRQEYDQQQINNHYRIRPRPLEYFFDGNPRPRPALPEPMIRSAGTIHTAVPGSVGASATNAMNGSSFATSLSSFNGASGTRSSFDGASGTRPRVRAEEASLPPRRANRRFARHPRPPAIPELCDGVVVRLPDGTNANVILEESEEEAKQQDHISGDGLNNGQRHGHRQSLRQGSIQGVARMEENDPSHIVVFCLGCGCLLRVHRLASLVKCAHCLSVSPSIPPDR